MRRCMLMSDWTDNWWCVPLHRLGVMLGEGGGGAAGRIVGGMASGGRVVEFSIRVRGFSFGTSLVSSYIEVMGPVVAVFAPNFE